VPTDLTQPGIYNALDTAYGGMTKADTTGLANQAALQATINAAVSHGGGTVLIPATDELATPDLGPYLIACPTGSSVAITIPPAEMIRPLVICGTGGATTLRMFSSGTMFEVTANPWVIFQDFEIDWQPDEEGSGGAAIVFNAGTGSVPPPNLGYRLFRMSFQDCPNPIQFNGNPAIATVRSCIFRYDTGYNTDEVTGISISGSQVDVERLCRFPGERCEAA
jgi:hypothetical protein